MPKYEITGPDGSRYEVDAPNDAAVQEAVTKMFGGSQTQPAQKPAPAVQTPPADTKLTNTVGPMLSAVQGATLGWGDEISAEISSTLAYLANLATGQGMSYGQVRDKAYQFYGDMYAPQREFAKDSPWIDGAIQVGSGLLSGSALTKLASAVAPRLAATGAQFATRNPYISAAGIGAGTSGLYAAGSADAGDKLDNAVLGTGLGLVAGPLGVAVGNGLSRGGSAALDWLNRAVGREAVDAAIPEHSALQTIAQRTTMDRGTSRIPAQPQPRNLANLSAREGGIIPLTRGQRTQNAEVQKLEQAALEGDFGAPSRIQMREVRTIQNNQIKNFLTELGDAKDPRQVNDIVSKLGETINTQARNMRGQIRSAYDLAREGQGIRIGRDEIKNGLLANIASARRDGGFDVSRMPEAAAVLRRLGGRVGGPSPNSRITSVALGELEAIRTQATQAAQRSTDPTEKAFLGAIVRNYDNFMSETAANAATEGDAAAINAFKNAVGLRAQYGRMFERNNLVKSIVEGRGADDLTRDLFGSSVVSGRAEMAKNLNAIFEAAGPQANAVKADMQTAVMKRLFERSARGFQEGAEAAMASPEEFISPAALAKNLSQLIANPEFTKNLYGPQALPVLRAVTRDLELMASRQPGTINNSGTAQRVFEIMKNTGMVDRIPGIGQLSAVISKGSELQAQSRAAGQVSQGLAEFIRTAPELAPKSEFLTRGVVPLSAGAGLAGAQLQTDRNGAADRGLIIDIPGQRR